MTYHTHPGGDYTAHSLLWGIIVPPLRPHLSMVNGNTEVTPGRVKTSGSVTDMSRTWISDLVQ